MTAATAPAPTPAATPRWVERPRPGLDAAVVVAPALLALGLCLYGLGSRSLGFDEGATVAIASGHGSALFHAIAHDGGNMAAYYLLLHGLIGLFGDGLWVIRSPSALAAAATVALTGVLALRLFGRRVAGLAGVLAATSLPLVFWGQAARGYASMVAFATASFVAFEALTAGRGRPRTAWVAYALCTALAVYCGFVAVLIVPAQLLVLIHRRGDTVRRVVAALAAAALCCLPLVVLAATRGSGQLFWVPRPSTRLGGQVLEAVASAGLSPSFHTTPTTLILLGLTALTLAVLAWTRPPRTALLWCWLLVPVALAWLESLVGQPVFIPRNLVTVLPAVAILLALAVTHRRLPRVAAGGLLVAFLVLRALQLAPAYGVSPEAWHSAATYVAQRAAPTDCIAFYPADAHMAYGYYARAPRSVLPSGPWTSPYVEDYASLPADRIAALPVRCPRLWLVWSHQGQADGPAAARVHLARFRVLRSALEGRYGAGQTRRFGYAATITVERLTAGASSPRRSGS